MTALRVRPEPLPRIAGWAVLGALVVFVAIGFARRVADHPGTATAGLALALAFGAVTILGPPRWLLPAAALVTLGTALIGDSEASNLSWFAVAVLGAWLAVSAPLLTMTAYGVAALVLFGAEYLFRTENGMHDPGWSAWVAGTVFAIVACYFGRLQRELLARLREAQAGLAARASAEDRNRIARELHDVIAHSLTVSLLHVSSARLALDEDRDEAARALEEAERLGRVSLDEVRHAVGLLRREGAPDPTAPLPGSLDVPALIEGFRDAGTDVRTVVEGDLGALSNTVGLATYRILQEALTNAAKHAPHTTASVHVTVATDAVHLAVESAGRPQRGSGLGLLGMRERAESLGGRCDAGPGGAGWLVRAELPLGTTR